MKTLSKLLELVTAPLRRARNVTKSIALYGKDRYCPVCGKSSRIFRPFGLVPRKDAQCVHCGALERHRFVWLFFQNKTNLFDGKPKTMLHVAPEPFFESVLKTRLGDNYLTADLLNPHAMVKMDICDIQYPNRKFDVICCNHVLEHVHDDRKAMKELFRVLKDNGWAILNVPISIKKTFEDSSIVEPEERLKAFGQKDHVRKYGADYIERLRDSGFTVSVINVDDLASSDEALRFGLTQASGEIYYCTK